MNILLRCLYYWLSLSIVILSSFIPCLGEPAGARKLIFYNLHTHERLEVVYKKEDQYILPAIEEINYILRDHRTDEVHSIDPNLLDFLYDVLHEVDYHGDIHVVSGYRSPETNKKLREKHPGISAKSLHMQGKALDFRLPGVDTRKLRDKALSLKRGGVGYYERVDFIQIDTGRVRFW